MTLLANQAFNDHLARQTAVVGIPLVVIAIAVLGAVDLRLLDGKRVGRLLVAASGALMVVAVGFMALRFALLRL